MKNIFEKTKTFIKENKKKVIIAIIGLVLIISASIYGAYILNDSTVSTDISSKTVTKSAKVKKEVKQDDNAKVDTNTAAKSNTTKSTTKSNNSSSNASNSGNTSSGNTSTSPAKKKVWIVDKAAWTETIKVPVYEDVDVYNLYATNRETRVEELLGKYYTYIELDNAMDYIDNNKYVNVRYSLTYESKVVRYDTKTINHPEEGHWEYR